MHIADIKVPQQWVKLEDLISKGRDLFVIEEGENYYIHNNSRYTLYLAESTGTPTEDAKEVKVYAGKSAGYAKAGADLYVCSKLPDAFQYPETIMITFCNDVAAKEMVTVGAYDPEFVETKGAYIYKGSVASRSDLPVEAEIGDVYNIEDEKGMNVAWNGSNWDNLGSIVDLSGCATKEELASEVATINAELAIRVTKEEQTEALAHKAEVEDVVALESRVDAAEDAIDLKAAASEVDAELTSLETRLDAAEQEIILKANKTALEAYALKTEIPTVPANVSAFTNDVGYLTEHQSLADYAKKEELPVVPTEVSAFNNDAGYLTEHQSLADYVTNEELEAKGYISAIAEEYITESELEAKGYLTEHQDISGLASREEVNAVGARVDGLGQDFSDLEARAVEYQDVATEENPDRKAIVLSNHDVILGKSTEGSSYNLAMVSKWNVADFGTKQLHTNLNTQQIVTINDTDAVATDKLLANFLLPGENMEVTQKDLQDPTTGFAFKAYEFKANIPEVDLEPYATKGQVGEVEAYVSSVLSRVDVLENRLSAMNKTNIEVVAAEAGSALALSDPAKDYVVSGAVDNTTQIAAKSVSLSNVALSARVSANVEGEFDMKASTISGSFPKGSAGNHVINVKEAEYITVKDTVIDATGYNAFEIGLQGDVLPKGILFDNCKFVGTFANNAVSIYGTQENAVVNFNNCSFEDVSNAIRLSNRTNTSCTVNITNCSCSKWDSKPDYAGIVLCEDHVSKTAAEVASNNLFGDGKIAINISNFTLPNGEKLTAPEDLSSICGSKTADQILYVYADAVGLMPYGAETYPSVSIS